MSPSRSLAVFSIIFAGCGTSGPGETGSGGQAGVASSSTAGAAQAGHGSMLAGSGGAAPGAAGAAALGGSGALVAGGTAGAIAEGGRAASAGLAGGGAMNRAGAENGGFSGSSVSGAPNGGRGGTPNAGGSAALGGRGGRSGGGASGASAGGASSGGASSGGASSGGASSGGPITVWLAGDSTVANGETPCPVGWGKVFAPYFDANVKVVNSAVGGRSVRTWLYSVEKTMDASGECVLDLDSQGDPILQSRWTTMLDGMKAGDYLFIQFGINDGDSTCERHVGLAAFKESYGMMADAAKARGVQPIFVTPVSAISCNGSKAQGTRGAYVTTTIDAGTSFDVPVIDLHALSVALYTSLGFCPLSGGDVSASTTGPVGDFFCDDHTHFDTPGATQIAGLVAKAIRDQKLGLAAHLK